MPTVQRMHPDQFERVRAVRLRALRDAPDAFWTTADEEERTTPTQWRERLASPRSVTFVAVDNGDDVGLVVGAPHHADQGDAGLYSMWVAPEARRKRVGSALVAAVIHWARDSGYRTLRLDVADGNTAAVRLYQRMGFAPTGVVDHLPPPRDHITEHERAVSLDVAAQR
jgi:ribosomal protein S18 acetylase RimI-like enzyme